MQAQVVAVCTSQKKGERKTPVSEVMFEERHGICDDAHAGPWHRQISLLAIESVEKMKALGLEVGPGDFGENLLTSGIDLVALPVGTQLNIGSTIVEVTQIGKECHQRCAIYHQIGDCVMPKEGIFVKVLEGGPVKAGSAIFILQ